MASRQELQGISMKQTMIAVPEGHHVSVHPPGQMPGLIPPNMIVHGAPMGAGQIGDPAQAGALQAMNAALPTPQDSPKSGKTKEQPKRKKKEGTKAAKKDNSSGE